MVAASLRTTDLPVEDRFAVWADLATRAHIATLVDTDHRSDFRASIEAHDFGVLKLSTMTHPPLYAKRTPAMVRDADPDLLLISHVRAGGMRLVGGGLDITANAGSFLLIDTSVAATVVNHQPVSDTIVQFPTSLLGLRRAQVSAFVSRPLAGDQGLGGLLAYVLDDLLRHGAGYPPALVEQLTATVVDLLGAAARVAAGAGTATAASLPEQARLLHLYAFIRRHLGDPRLTPEWVAAAHGMSLRQLNRVLHDDGSSPADWIRRQRLDRCRRDLVDPAQATGAVADIGARWGFPDPVTFNRAFRRAYGMPPGEYRRRFGAAPTCLDLA